MRRTLGSRKQRRMGIMAVFWLALALFATVMGCPPGSDPALEYDLTISSTAGGSVTAPGEGAFTYPTGTVVQLVVAPDEGYEFRSWTGDTGHIANRNSATTTVTMNGSYSISASFGEEGEGGGPISP